MGLVSWIRESKLSFRGTHRTIFESDTTHVNLFVRFNLLHPPCNSRILHAESFFFIYNKCIESFTPELNISDSWLVGTSQECVVNTSFLTVNVKLIITSPHLSDAFIIRELTIAHLIYDWFKYHGSENLSVELKEVIDFLCLGSRVQTGVRCLLSNVLKSHGTLLVLVRAVNKVWHTSIRVNLLESFTLVFLSKHIEPLNVDIKVSVPECSEASSGWLRNDVNVKLRSFLASRNWIGGLIGLTR